MKLKNICVVKSCSDSPARRLVRQITGAGATSGQNRGGLVFGVGRGGCRGVLVASVLWFAAAIGVAGPLQEGDVVVFATGSENYPPFSGPQLESGGMFSEIVRRAFTRMGYRVKIEFLSWENAKDLTLKRNAYLGTFPWFKNSLRERMWKYSAPLFVVDRRVFKRANDTWTYTGNESLIGKTLCRPADYYIHDLQKLVEAGQISVERPETAEKCFALLLKGAVDAVSLNRYLGEDWITRNSKADVIQMESQSMGEDPLYVIFPSTNRWITEPLAKFNQEIKAMEKSGELSEIVERHMRAFHDR